jgi:hypothetical protein
VTPAQSKALAWLKQHNGTGVLNKYGVLLAAGELAPFRRSTWNALRDAGAVDIYRIGSRGPARIAVALGRT